MDNVTVEYALKCMCFEEYTNIAVRKMQDGHRSVQIGGSPYASIISKRYGQEVLLSSSIVSGVLVLVVA